MHGKDMQTIFRTKRVTPKREVEWDGRFYKVRSNSIPIPVLTTMERFAALTWLCTHTYPRGYSRSNPLAGFAGAISVASK